MCLNSPGSRGPLEPAPTLLPELMACISSQLHVQWHHVGNVKLATERVFMSQKAATATNKDCFPPAEAVAISHRPGAWTVWEPGCALLTSILLSVMSGWGTG